MTTSEQALPRGARLAPGGDAVWRLAVPLAAGLALWGYGARELVAEGAAQTGWLALLAAVTLLPAAFLARRPGEVALGATLVVAAAWVLPAGPAREAVVVTALAGLLVVAGARRLAASLPELPLAVALPLGLAAQMLLRAEVLLPPAPERLGSRLPVILVALPAAAALATVALARRHGAPRALVAAGAALLLGPGWNVTTTLGLVALAAGGAAADRTLGRGWRLAALAVLVAPLAWDPRGGALAAGAGLALATARWAPAIGLAVALPLATLLSVRGPAEAAGMLAWLPLLLPAVVLPAADRRPTAFAAVLLALGAAGGGPSAAALAAPLALAALSLRRRGAGLAAQGAWTVALLAATTLLAGPPWLREEPLAKALGLLGVPRPAFGGAHDLAPAAGIDAGVAVSSALAGSILQTVLAVLAVAATWLALGPGLDTVLRGRLVVGSTGAGGWSTGRIAAGAAGAAVLVALLVQLPPAGIAPLPGDVVLAALSPVWETTLPAAGPAVRSVVLDSTLANSASLPAGCAVASVRLRDAAGRERVWTVRAGRDTGEWAAARADVAGQLRAGTPEPWLSWVAGDFQAHRYRATWRLQDGAAARVVRIERAGDLPPDVVVALHHLELRR